MGISRHNLDLFHRFVMDQLGRPVNMGDLRMLELGNQWLYIDDKPRPAKPYFQSIGFFHVSVDLNGQDGALPFDLTQPLPFAETIGLRGLFDVVTDFGTSEHVSDLYTCLLNIDRSAKSGALIFHSNPEPGSWPGHGRWYRGMDFYTQFAALTGYEILNLHRHAAMGNDIDGWETTCVMRRGPALTFPSREEFDTLPIARW